MANGPIGNAMISMTVAFVDTNVLVYAHNRRDDRRHPIARDLLTRLTEDGTGAVSIQVLQEWVNVVTRRVPVPLTLDEAVRVIRDFDTAGWRIISPQVGDVIEALTMMPRWQLSRWDALIVTAAQVAGATVLWTEDLNHGQKFGPVTIQNPFHH
jgi:predicted nucleic acid-binding protein